MYTIDAYNVEAMQAHQDSTFDRTRAFRKAGRLSKLWPIVEIRNISRISDGQIIALWLDGVRQY